MSYREIERGIDFYRSFPPSPAIISFKKTVRALRELRELWESLTPKEQLYLLKDES